MAKMSVFTRTTLIDAIGAALQSRKTEDICAIQYLLKIKCNQHQISWLTFLVDEALPAINMNVMQPLKIVVDSESLMCPYCKGRLFKSTMGLKAHLGRMHQDKKESWSIHNSH